MAIKLRNIDPVVLLVKVGVGIENPSSKIHISDASNSDGFIKLTNSSNSRTSAIGVDAEGLYLKVGDSAESIDFRTSNGYSILNLDTSTGYLRLGGHSKTATSLLHLYAPANSATDEPILTLEADSDGSPRVQFTQNSVAKGYLEWDHNTQSLSLNPGSGYVYVAEKMGVKTAPASTDTLKVGGRLNVTGGIYSGTTEILDTSNKIDYALLKSAPSWIDATQGNVVLADFKDNLGWSRVGVTGDVKPTWLAAAQSSVNLSDFNNDLGPSSQWTDDTTGVQGVYYNKHVKIGAPALAISTVDDSAVLGVNSTGDGLATLRLQSSGAGGSSWNFIATETVHSGGGGKLAIVPTSADETLSKLVIQADGKVSVNTSAATSLYENLTVTGNAGIYGGELYISADSDDGHLVFINSSSTVSNYQDWWYVWRRGASGSSADEPGEKLKFFYLDQDGFVLPPTWQDSTRDTKTGVGVVVNGSGSSATSGFNLEVVGAIRCTSITQTSDQNKKRDITDSDLGLEFINKLRPIRYFWKDESREFTRKDGQVNAVNLEYSRPHYGLLAQQVKVVMDEVGVDDFGAYKDSTIKNPEKTAEYGLDYNQFVAPLIKAIQELTERVESLENS